MLNPWIVATCFAVIGALTTALVLAVANEIFGFIDKGKRDSEDWLKNLWSADAPQNQTKKEKITC